MCLWYLIFKKITECPDCFFFRVDRSISLMMEFRSISLTGCHNWWVKHKRNLISVVRVIFQPKPDITCLILLITLINNQYCCSGWLVSSYYMNPHQACINQGRNKYVKVIKPQGRNTVVQYISKSCSDIFQYKSISIKIYMNVFFWKTSGRLGRNSVCLLLDLLMLCSC